MTADARLIAEPRGGEDALWGRLARWAPAAIALYALVLVLVRVQLSPFLEVDEAEFVGRVDLRLVYDNSHPPFFNWLARAALEVTGWDWPLSLALVKYGLLGAFHWFVFDAARRLGGDRAGVLALSASAFLPQVVWMSAVTLAHSIAVMACAAGVVWAASRLSQSRRLELYLALGAFAAAGALSKFNFALFLAPFLAAIALDPAHGAILRDRRAWAALGLFFVLIAPSHLAAALNLADSAGRIEKLYRPGDLAWLDPPLLGVDGLVTLVVAFLAWAAAALAVWAIARRLDGAWRLEPPSAGFERVLGRAMALALGLFAAIVLFADMHKVEERYLTPLLTPLPIFLAVAWPLRRSALAVTALASTLYLAVAPSFWAMAAFGKHRFGLPYAAIAESIAAAAPEPLPIITARHDDAANLILALGWTGAASPAYAPIQDAALLVWRGAGDPPLRFAPERFAPEGSTQTYSGRYANAYDGDVVYSFQKIVFREVGE